MAKRISAPAMSRSLPLVLLASLLLLAVGAVADDEPAKAVSEPTPIEQLMPDEGSLFSKDVIDKDALDDMDCHLRNMDYCLAGVVGSAGKMLPENDQALEARCDEMQTTITCLAVFEDRCQVFKMMGRLIPQMNMNSGNRLSAKRIAEQAASMNFSLDQATGQLGSAFTGDKFSSIDLIQLCEKSQKGTANNTAVRKKLFEISKCVNGRLPSLKPCIEDVKTAMQLNYEQSRALARRPACCAWSRFRACSTQALDNLCGFNSFNQLESALQGGPFSMLRSFGKACETEEYKSDFCQKALPPSGLKVPARRGQKASKFARILDLIQFAGV